MDARSGRIRARAPRVGVPHTRASWRRLPRWAWFGGVAILTMTAVLERGYEGLLATERRGAAIPVVDDYANALQAAFARRVAPLRALQALLESAPRSSGIDPELEPFTDGLHASVEGVRAYQYVRGGVIRFTSHPDSNPGVLGYDLTASPIAAVREGAQAALLADDVVLTGPVALIQGGSGFIARRRVFAPGDPRFGSVATVFHVAPVLEEARIPEANVLSGLRLALRDAAGTVITGDSAVFAGQSAQVVVSLPGTTWTLAAVPATGTWLGSDAWRVRILAGLVGLLAILLLLRVARHQEHLETGLASQHALLLAVVEGSPDPVFVRDIDGRYVTVNAAAARSLGLVPANFAGKLPGELLPPLVAAQVMEVHRAVLASGLPTTSEVQIPVADQERTYQTTHHPWRAADGTVLGVISIARDLTERLALEEDARHAHRLEGLGRLAGGIAHDFNNLLTTIRGNAEILTKTLPDAPKVIHDDLKAITAAAQRGAELSRKLLAFSRFEPVVRRPVDLVEIVQVATAGLRLPADLTLKTSMPSDATMIAASPEAIRQILDHLADNAVSATRGGGTITVRVERDETQAHLVIEDTGHGMDGDTAKRAFDPFFTTRGDDGAEGLGLSAVYGVVQQLGGTVTLTSVPGTGTSVIVSLPRLRGSGDPRAVTRGERQTILVVEDEEAVRRTACRALEVQGYRVIAATNGVEALTVLQGQRVDLVLTDMVMPVMDGATLFRTARQRGLTVPFVFCTGYAKLASDAAQADLQGAFLMKPWTLDELGNAVATALH